MTSRLGAFLAILFLAAPPFAASPSSAAETRPAAERAGEEWHLVLIGDQPAGYLRISVGEKEGGVRTMSLSQKLVLRRGRTPVEIETSTVYEEDAQGSFLGFRHTQKLSQGATVSTGEVKGPELVIQDSVGDAPPRESKLPLREGAVGPRRAEELMREKLRAPGDELELILFFPEVRRFGTQRAVLLGEETVSCRGPARKLRHLTVTQDVLPGVVSDEWVDEEFDLQKSAMEVFGLKLVTCRTSLEEVLSQDFSSPPEIFFASSVPSDRRVRERAQSAVYRLVAKGESFPILKDSYLSQAPGQKLLGEPGGGARTLEVSAIAPEATQRRPVAPSPELEEYLRPNLYIQSDDPRIREIAADAVGEETDAWKAAQALERWVQRNLRRKNLNTAFAPAAEVARTREGDCTEHAVLLAALLRAAGIPSRVVAGIVHHDGSFVGHMWTEARVGGWVPLDATVSPERKARGGLVPANRIALAAGSLDSSSAAEFFLGMVPVLGNLKIEVVEVKP